MVLSCVQELAYKTTRYQLHLRPREQRYSEIYTIVAENRVAIVTKDIRLTQSTGCLSLRLRYSHDIVQCLHSDS